MWFVKKYLTFASSIFFFFFFFFLYIYKMFLISAEGYKNGGVQFIRVWETGEIWASMKDAGSGMGC